MKGVPWSVSSSLGIPTWVIRISSLVMFLTVALGLLLDNGWLNPLSPGCTCGPKLTLAEQVRFNPFLSHSYLNDEQWL